MDIKATPMHSFTHSHISFIDHPMLPNLMNFIKSGFCQKMYHWNFSNIIVNICAFKNYRTNSQSKDVFFFNCQFRPTFNCVWFKLSYNGLYRQDRQQCSWDYISHSIGHLETDRSSQYLCLITNSSGCTTCKWEVACVKRDSEE